ncbi:protein Shroom3-like isoform X2 [Palaemon carinicauda]|uniref:protein Shroom3-like isoform X2 n=1 Tax=Palaemon carinicauda TaxID=392227 RepID=UPI0035B5E1BB
MSSYRLSSVLRNGTYHKDSYMAHRRDWKTGFEGRYRRTISPSAANRNLCNRDDNTNNNQSNASNNNNNLNNSSTSTTPTSPLPPTPQEQQERRNSSTPPGGTVHRNHSTSNLVQTNNSKNANEYDNNVNNNGWTCHGLTTSTTVNFTTEELRAFKARRAHAHIQDAGALSMEKEGGERPLHTSQSSPALSSALRSAASDGSTTSLASGGGGSSLSSGHSGSASPTKLSPASSLRASVDSLHRPSSTSTVTSHSPRPITRATSLADPLHPQDESPVVRSNSMSQEAIHYTSTASINESLSRISAINDSLSRSTSMAESLCRSTSVTEAPNVAPAGPQIHAHNVSETNASTSSPSSSSHQSSPSSAPATSTVPTAPASPTSPVPHDGPITAHPATVTEEVSPGPPPPLTISNKPLTTKSPPSPKSPLASKSLMPVSPLSPNNTSFSSKSPVSSSTSPVVSPTSSKMCAFPSISHTNSSSVSNTSPSTSLMVTSSLDATTTATTTLSYPITSPSMSPATLPVDHNIIVLGYGRTRYQEEIDCDQLSKDYMPQLTVDSKLLALLAPGPEYKTAAHYMQGVFSLELRKDLISSTHAQHPDLSHIHQNSAMPPNTSTATNGVPNTTNEKAPLPSDSAYFTTSESKAKLLTRLRGSGSNLQDGVTTVTDQQQLHKKKEELVASIGRKLEILRAEREAIKEEMRLNHELGAEVTSLVEERARLAESEKYKLHVEEIDKITSLLLGLSGRLARAENALMLSKEADPEERRILEGKRDKLSEQLEEAKRLKENIDRRAIQVSKVLNQYLNEDEYADYDHFIKMKAKLIMDAREIDDKVKLGEEQQQALIETICKK